MAFLRRRRKQGEQLARDVGALYDAEDKQLEAWDEMLEHRPPAVAPGVDISAITGADPTFDDQLFLSIVRESFSLIREARATENIRLAQGLMSPQLERELKFAIDGDVASHRNRLLPGLEVETAVITGAQINDGKFVVTVRMHLWVGDDTTALAEGFERGAAWDEDWTCWRDPAIDATWTDWDHAMRRESQGQWLFAHKGWIIIAIEREGADAAVG